MSNDGDLCFADTFYWLALLNVDDAHHEKVTAADIRGRKAGMIWAALDSVGPGPAHERWKGTPAY